MITTIDLGDFGEVEAEIEYDYKPPTPDVWYMRNGDPGYPGDPEEININFISFRFADFTLFIKSQYLTDHAYEKICDKISEYESDKEK